MNKNLIKKYKLKHKLTEALFLSLKKNKQINTSLEWAHAIQKTPWGIQNAKKAETLLEENFLNHLDCIEGWKTFTDVIENKDQIRCEHLASVILKLGYIPEDLLWEGWENSIKPNKEGLLMASSLCKIFLQFKRSDNTFFLSEEYINHFMKNSLAPSSIKKEIRANFITYRHIGCDYESKKTLDFYDRIRFGILHPQKEMIRIKEFAQDHLDLIKITALTDKSKKKSEFESAKRKALDWIFNFDLPSKNLNESEDERNPSLRSATGQNCHEKKFKASSVDTDFSEIDIEALSSKQLFILLVNIVEEIVRSREKMILS